MKSAWLKNFCLLFLLLGTQNNFADTLKCPSSELLKTLNFIRARQGSGGPALFIWRINTASFSYDNHEWMLYLQALLPTYKRNEALKLAPAKLREIIQINTPTANREDNNKFGQCFYTNDNIQFVMAITPPLDF